MLELELKNTGDHEKQPRGPLGGLLLAASEAFAMAGGIIAIALVVMSIVSIVGRKLFAVVVPGDLELMQMGMAVAIAAFLPYCQMNDGHVRVDLFTNKLSVRTRALLESFAAFLLAFSAALIAWRTYVGAVSSYESGETSLMLGWPIWYSVAAIVPSFVLLVLTGLYVAARKFSVFKPCWTRRAGTPSAAGRARHEGDLVAHSMKGSKS